MRIRDFVRCAATALLLATAGQAVAAETIAHWSFDTEPTVDRLEGNRRFVDGVDGSAVFFDGYTTALVREAGLLPDLRAGFTLAGWIAIAAYPWGPVPIVNQSRGETRGFSFDVTARGALKLSAVTNEQTLTATSADYLLPHRQWVHVAATFDPAAGLAVFLDGERVAFTPIPADNDFGGRNPTGALLQAGELDLLIGATRAPIRPAGYHRYKGSRPSWMSFDGLIDELSVFDTVLSERDLEQLAVAYRPGEPPMADRILPSGPPGPGRFGAYQATLEYHPEWDALSRVGEHADIVVRFDTSPARVVFWRGTQYSPAWVTGNGFWMADQSVEGYDDDYTWEHMNDKHNRYSHVRVIENHDARVVVHWRYAPVDVHDRRMNVGKRDEMGAWVDEYFTFYPDATGVRNVTWKTGTLGEPVQFQESIPLLHPGQVQGDIIDAVYATVGNLAGDTQTLAYVTDNYRKDKPAPDDLTIQMHHFKSDQKPFIVFEPGNRMTYLWDLDERSLRRPGSSSHWPVGKIWSDGRTAQAPDRATSFLGFPISEPPIRTANGRSRISSLYGMTDQPFDSVVELARSWSRAPAVRVTGGAFESSGFDRSERVYRFVRRGEGSELSLDFAASDASPLFNVPILVEGWGDGAVSVDVDGVNLPRGPDFRYGYVHTLEDTHLVVWLGHKAATRSRIRLSGVTDAD